MNRQHRRIPLAVLSEDIGPGRQSRVGSGLEWTTTPAPTHPRRCAECAAAQAPSKE